MNTVVAFRTSSTIHHPVTTFFFVGIHHFWPWCLWREVKPSIALIILTWSSLLSMPVDIPAVDIPPFPTSWLLFDSKSNTLLPKNIMVTRYPYLPMLDTIKPTVKWIGTEHCRMSTHYWCLFFSHPSAFEDFVTHDTMSFSDFIHRGIVDQKTHTSAWSYYKIYVSCSYSPFLVPGKLYL